MINPDSENAPTPGTRSSKDDRRVLAIVFFTVFLDLIGFGILIPIQPFFAKLLGASPTLVTWLGASFSLMQFIFASFWGRLSDRVGRRPVMLGSILITIVGYTLFGMSSSLAMLFFARMLAGFGSANIGTAQAIIADSTTPETRAKGMGLLGAAFGLGFILGPALGGAFVPLGLSAPAYVAAVLCLVNFNFAYFMLPETRSAKVGTTLPTWRAQLRDGFEKLVAALNRSSLVRILAIYLLWTTGFSLMEQVMGLTVEAYFVPPTGLGNHAELAAKMTAAVLFVVGVVATIIQGGAIGPLTRRFGEKALFLVGACLVSLAFFAVPKVGALGQYPLFVGLFGLVALGSGITHPSLASLLSQVAEPQERGGIMGLGQSLSALGRVLGPALAGPLFEIKVGLPFQMGAVLLLIAALVGTTLEVTKAK